MWVVTMDIKDMMLIILFSMCGQVRPGLLRHEQRNMNEHSWEFYILFKLFEISSLKMQDSYKE